jgi:uncharacterized membrane protein (DUF4010 family)
MRAMMLATYFQHLFPPTEVATKLAISLGIGTLVGLEREWAHKDVGVRTFAITSLAGMLAALMGREFSVAVVIGVFVLVIFVNLRVMLVNRSLEITTSAALIAVALLGILVGEGHMFTPVSSAIIITMLLAWKTELTRFAGGLTPQEIRSAVLLGLLSLVIYPILPNHFIDKWNLLNPREAWIAVVVLAGIGFVNYVFLRIYSNQGLYYAAALGGLVNSTATVAELSRWLRPAEDESISRAVGLILLTRISMFLRNLTILLIFGRAAVGTAVWPLLCMAFAAALITWIGRKNSKTAVHELELSSPISLRRVLTMGSIFVVIQVASSLAERHLGHLGFLVVSFIGGFVSSASTTASAALMASDGTIAPHLAGAAAVLATVSSSLVTLPLIYQQTRHKALSRAVAFITVAIALLGLGVLVFQQKLLQ